MTCVCDEKGPCLYHKEKNMRSALHKAEYEDGDDMEPIHFDLEQTIREARREPGVSLRSIASILVEVLDADEIKSLVHEIYAASDRLQADSKK